MKPFNVFAHVFAIFAFLTIGSLMMIVAFHILTLPDAIHQLQQLYEKPSRSFQTGSVGLSFIVVGLFFTRMLIKKRRPAEALIFQSEIGPIIVSITAIEDVVKKVLKRFHLIKDWKTKTLINGKDVEIRLRLVLWAGGRIQDLLTEIQEETKQRVRKLLGAENRLEVVCDVQRIEDHEVNLADDLGHDKAVSL